MDIRGSCFLGILSFLRESPRKLLAPAATINATMKTELFLQFTLLLIILSVSSSEGFFFSYPKKVIMNFLQSLKDKKEMKKKPTHIQHYHLHYYPVPTIVESPIKAPTKHDLGELHNQHLSALGWSDHEYAHLPKPRIKIPVRLLEAWGDSVSWNQEILDLSESFEHSGDDSIYVEVPYSQKIIIENDHSRVSKKSKSAILSALLQKLSSFKDYAHKKK
ncbi:uncharacterized protein LOC128891410 [Hylaeus anthracinus]|uniref:uncharacterized protein LOC128891410 n=1 Tax=Hylaeus anthracinus TaxID=313031 RepID=UPI0023B8B066|nr:uncharacterized protein LOC128891410 [Hylaeus anthracinus]